MHIQTYNINNQKKSRKMNKNVQGTNIGTSQYDSTSTIILMKIIVILNVHI